MSLLRRYSGKNQSSAPQGLDERTDYEEDRNAALFRTMSRGNSLRRPSPMPSSPRSSFSSPSSSPRAPLSRRTSGNWTPSESFTVESSIEEEPPEQPLSPSWAAKVDSALHNLPYEHDASNYKSGAFVPQHAVAGQTYNYRRISPTKGGVVETIVEDAPVNSDK